MESNSKEIILFLYIFEIPQTEQVGQVMLLSVPSAKKVILEEVG
jgi:hypothetical protein